MALPPKDPKKASGEARGMLKPKLSWAAVGNRAPAGSSRPPTKAGRPSNAKPISEYSLDELKKMAASRGLPLEKLVAQMVQQYLKEDGAL